MKRTLCLEREGKDLDGKLRFLHSRMHHAQNLDGCSKPNLPLIYTVMKRNVVDLLKSDQLLTSEVTITAPLLLIR